MSNVPLIFITPKLEKESTSIKLEKQGLSPIVVKDKETGGIIMDYRVLLYYNYTTIEDPEAFAKEHLAFVVI